MAGAGTRARGRAAGAGGPERPGLRLFALVLLAVAAGYGFTARDFFLSDDFGFLTRATGAQSVLRGLDLELPVTGMWVRPLVAGSWYLNAQVGDGLDPLGYHLVNLGFHALNAWLVGCLAAALGLGRRAAAAAALMFAVFPLHPEAVTWLSGRVDVLCTSAALAACFPWIRFARDGSRAALFLAALGVAAALLCKEMAITLPVLLPALALLVLRAPLRRVAGGALVLVVVAGLYLGLRFYLLGGIGGYEDEQGSVATHLDLGQAATFTRRAVRHALVPAAIGALPGPLPWLRFVPALALAGGALLALLDSEGRVRLARAGVLLLLALLALAPVANWAWLESDYQSTRFLYLPSALFLIASGALLPFSGERQSAVLFGALLALVLGVHALGVVHVNREWHSAARIAELSLERLDALAPEHGAPPPLAVVGLPDLEGSAYVWKNGFTEGARSLTRWKGQVVELEEEEWARILAEMRRSPPKGRRVYLRWDGGNWRRADRE